MGSEGSSAGSNTHMYLTGGGRPASLRAGTARIGCEV